MDRSLVRDRWLKPKQLSNNNSEEQTTTTGGLFVALKPVPKKNIDRSKPCGKYNEVVDVCKQLASLISVTRGKQYEERLSTLHSLVDIYLSGKEAKVLAND